ncbi:MAG: F0F1 ATP synthase subunit B [Candidatus Poribacteria bacterium]|nr:F0F1 ATP synthase subunit B [Candidatus Poribacteria bacterium]
MRNIKHTLSLRKERSQRVHYRSLYGCCIILMSMCLSNAFAAEVPAGEGGLLALLGIDPQTIIIQVIGFLIVLAVLWKFVFGKVGGLLEERRTEITTQSEQLRTDREELDRLTAETRQRLADIETEAQAKIQAAIEQGNVERQQILAEARQEADDEVTRARAEIQREKDEAISELRGVVAELAIDAASKIISEELNAERHQHIIDASISRLPTE